MKDVNKVFTTTRVLLDVEKAEKPREDEMGEFVIYLDGKRKVINNREFEFAKEEGKHWSESLKGTKGIISVDGSLVEKRKEKSEGPKRNSALRIGEDGDSIILDGSHSVYVYHKGLDVISLEKSINNKIGIENFVFIDEIPPSTRLINLQNLLKSYQSSQGNERRRENAIIITNLEECIAREKSKNDKSIFE